MEFLRRIFGGKSNKASNDPFLSIENAEQDYNQRMAAEVRSRYTSGYNVWIFQRSRTFEVSESQVGEGWKVVEGGVSLAEAIATCRSWRTRKTPNVKVDKKGIHRVQIAEAGVVPSQFQFVGGWPKDADDWWLKLAERHDLEDW